MVIKLQDKFKVLKDAREPRPSMRETRLEERSRCRRCQTVVSPSILGMWLQCRLSEVVEGGRGTSNRLEREKKQAVPLEQLW